MYFKFFAATVVAVPFSLAGTGFTHHSATALAINLSTRQPLATNQVTLSSPTLIAQTTWNDFSSSEGNFAILMPGTPTHEKETDDDGFISNSFTVELENPYRAYVVYYYDVPEALTDTPEQVKKLFDMTSDAFTEGGKANLTRSQSIILDGNPGKEFEFTSNEGFSGKGRVYLVKQRLFVVVAIAPQTQNIQRFLDSFRLL